MARRRRSGASGSNQLLKRGRKRYFGEEQVQVEWTEGSDLFMDFNMERLVAKISELSLKLHVEAIEAGEKADGSGDQPPLKKGSQQDRLAKKGERPPHRGHTGRQRGFPRRLRRTKISLSRVVNGVPTRATTTLGVGTRVLRGFLANELRKRGIRYLYGYEGDIKRQIEEILEEEAKKALDGTGKRADSGRKDGSDVSR